VSVAHTHRGDAATILLAGAAIGVLDGLFADRAPSLRLPGGTAGTGLQASPVGSSDRPPCGGRASALLGLGAFRHRHHLGRRLLGGVGQSRELRRILQTTAGTIAIGALFGAFVWLVMRFGVIPAAGLGGRTVQIRQFLVMLIGHMVVVGQPIAWIIARRLREAGQRVSGSASQGVRSD
jgi:hypothetical protein